MAKAIDLTKFEYILKADRNDENPTVFEMQRLDGITALEVGDAAATGQTERAYQLAFKKGLLGWRNFDGPDFNPKDMAANRRVLSVHIQAELMQQLDDKTGLSEDELKN